MLDILCNLCKGSGVAVRSSQVIISLWLRVFVSVFFINIFINWYHYLIANQNKFAVLFVGDAWLHLKSLVKNMFTEQHCRLPFAWEKPAFALSCGWPSCVVQVILLKYLCSMLVILEFVLQNKYLSHIKWIFVPGQKYICFRPNIFVGSVAGSALYSKWYFEVKV